MSKFERLLARLDLEQRLDAAAHGEQTLLLVGDGPERQKLERARLRMSMGNVGTKR